MALKIREIEDMMQAGDFSEKTVSAFKNALKHVPKDSRCEHCYYTAISMGAKYKESALKLLRIGMDYTDGFWLETMRCHRFAGLIFEQHKEYDNALRSYKYALSSVPEDMKSQYFKEYSYLFLRVELHRSNFTYTDDLFKYFNQAILSPRYRGMYDEKLFHTAVARILIAEKQNQFEKARIAYFTAISILNMQNSRSLAHLLKQKDLSETISATKEITCFLQSLRACYENYN